MSLFRLHITTKIICSAASPYYFYHPRHIAQDRKQIVGPCIWLYGKAVSIRPGGLNRREGRITDNDSPPQTFK